MDEKINSHLPTKGDVITAEEAIKLAIEIAVEGAPFVSPNPLVGCVIVSESHHYLASGFHRRYGQAHAEIEALKNLDLSELRNAIMYVTLEPCAHEGKTGSCAKKIATLPVKKVIYGRVDPNPLVSGQGAEILKLAGIEAVEYQGPHKTDLSELCEIFLKNFSQKKIFVAAKIASSLDGQIALKNYESKWITSPESREYVHELRSYYDATLVGRNTIEVDNPSLNIRHPKIEKTNKIIVLDGQGEILRKVKDGQSYRFLSANKKENIYFAVHKKIENVDHQQIVFSDLSNLLQLLWDLNFYSLFIEGGAATYSSFLKLSLVDRIYLFMAPVIMGNGISWTQDIQLETMESKLQINQLKTKIIGPDVFMTGIFSAGFKS